MSTQNSAQWFNPVSDRLEAGGIGIIASRLSTAQRTALVLGTTDAGLTTFDTTLGGLFVWSGTGWISGGLVLTGAADTQVLFDDGGAVAGNAALTFTKATGALNMTGPLISTAGPLTASTPQVQLAQVWNNAGVTFTGVVMNITDSASNAASVFADFQIAGSSRIQLRKDGAILLADGSASNPTISFYNQPTKGFHHVASTDWVCYGAANRDIAFGASSFGGFYVRSDVGIGWSSTTDAYSGALGVGMWRDANAILAIRNSTTAQGFRVYNTYTDASNYERGVFDWTTTANTLSVGTASGGTGSNRAMNFIIAGTARWGIDASGHFRAVQQRDFYVQPGSTTMTLGFIYMPSGAGAPTGVPSNAGTFTGTVPTYVDSTNAKFYAYISGAWKSVQLL